MKTAEKGDLRTSIMTTVLFDYVLE